MPLEISLFRKSPSFLPAIGLLAFLAPAQTTRNMTVLGNFNPSSSQKYASVWGYHGTNGKEYALLTVQGQGTGGRGGTHIVDISNPASPASVGFIASPKGLWHEVKTWKQVMYKCADQGDAGVQIVDLSPVSSGQPPRELTAYTGGNGSPPVTQCHNLWLDTTRTPALLYVVQPSRTQGVAVLSLEDPVKPVERSRIATEAHDMYARGNRVYISTGDTHSWDIWNITNPAAPVRIARTLFNPTNQKLGEPTKNPSGNPRLYSHNVWVSDDGKHAFTTEETVGTTVKSWDISNEAAPAYMGKYIANPAVVAHNVLLNGRYMQVPHYGQGLRILDVGNPAAMVEVAYHKPSNTTEVFGGTWGSYGWFKSGVYIHADDYMGLYIVRPNLPTAIELADRERISAMDRKSRVGMLFNLPKGGGNGLSLSDLAGRRIPEVRARTLAVTGPH